MNHPWRDEERLRGLYKDEKMPMREVAGVLGCDPQTIKNWLDKHGIETRTRWALDQPALFRTHVNGYEQWRDRTPTGEETVYVHRLLATLLVDDLSEMAGEEVHHQNGIPWLNTDWNITLEHPHSHKQEHGALSFLDRLAIMEQYAHTERTQHELAEVWGVGQSTISRTVNMKRGTARACAEESESA